MGRFAWRHYDFLAIDTFWEDVRPLIISSSRGCRQSTSKCLSSARPEIDGAHSSHISMLFGDAILSDVCLGAPGAGG